MIREMNTYSERLAKSTCVFCGSSLLLCQNKCDYCGCDYIIGYESKSRIINHKNFKIKEMSITKYSGDDRFMIPDSTRLNISYFGENIDFDHSIINRRKINFSLNYKDVLVECIGGFVIKKEKSDDGFHYLNNIEVDADQIIIHQ